MSTNCLTIGSPARNFWYSAPSLPVLVTGIPRSVVAWAICASSLRAATAAGTVARSLAGSVERKTKEL
jgi:hypothetical protein